MRHVLVATDGGPESRRAEALAIDLAKSYRGRLVAIAVVHIAGEEERGDQMAQAMETISSFRARAHAQGVAAEGRVVTGKPADEIVGNARQEGVDAIVIGTHGREGLAHALLGSVAEKVVRTADRTVIVAK